MNFFIRWFLPFQFFKPSKIRAGYWMDVGQPKDFVIGSSLYLDHVSKTKPDLLCKHESCVGKSLIIRSLNRCSLMIFWYHGFSCYVNFIINTCASEYSNYSLILAIMIYSIMH